LWRNAQIAKDRGMRIALFQPDIAGNVGTILRLAACFGVAVDIIEPCGFPFSERSLKRAGMDYAAQAEIVRHIDWNQFRASLSGRLVLLSTKGTGMIAETGFLTGDTLLMGSESAGVPDFVHQAADIVTRIPLRPGFRSLNVAVAAGIALHEAMRQAGTLPQ
jgi:tRNA (cytidine/uridine-2'-O-)-methyltransferase